MWPNSKRHSTFNRIMGLGYRSCIVDYKYFCSEQDCSFTIPLPLPSCQLLPDALKRLCSFCANLSHKDALPTF